MTMTDELTGIFSVHAVLATGRTLDTVGTDDDVALWLDELRSVETVLDLDVHELTGDELIAYGPVYDGPCSDGEEGA